MRIKSLILAGLIAGLLSGCFHKTRDPRPDYGARVADDAPPSSQETYYEDQPGKVWVPGRWARLNDQWVWQPGFHQDERKGHVYVAGHWDRDVKTGKFVWVDGGWEPEREGVTYVPGHWGKSGETVVWYRDKWVANQPGTVWMKGTWKLENGEHVWVEGHFAQLSAEN